MALNSNPRKIKWSLISLLIILVAIEVPISKATSRREMFGIPKPPNPITVRMANKVGAPLTVHCKSAEEDLGTHTLVPGMSYEFNFTLIIWSGETLVSCQMQWPGFLHDFDVYDQGRDQGRCLSECLWDINTPGLCDPRISLCFPWNDQKAY